MTAWDLDREPLALLTVGNPKTAKGEGHGYLTAILHLSPADGSGVIDVCPFADGCVAPCLNTAGRGGIALDGDGLNGIQAARVRRTRLFKRDRAAFLERLAGEIERHVRTAERHGLKPAVRLNGTSDLPWERFPVRGAASLMRLFPDVTFYDYTKWPRERRGERRTRELPPNYSLTFSLAVHNDAAAADALVAGVNVAAVFRVKRGAQLPQTFMGAPVIDGDTHDLRFMDPAGVIVGLRAKGRAIHDRSGFVRAA